MDKPDAVSRWIEELRADVRYALRTLLKNRGFSALAVATLGLGIGANTANFSVINGVLLKPLPYDNGDRLLLVRHSAPLANQQNLGVSIKELYDYREQLASFDGLVEFHQMNFDLLRRGEPDRVATGVVSPNFFTVLGIRPIAGRTFADADDREGADAVLVLGHSYWQTRFGGDRNIIGQVFEMNDRPHTVIGVLPPVPHYPQRSGRLHADVGVSLPRRRRAADQPESPGVPGAPGVRPAQAGRFAPNSRRRGRDRRPALPAGLSECLPSGAHRFPGAHRAGARRADEQRPADVDHPARHDRSDPADRVRQRRQPDARADAQARPGVGDAQRARRRPEPSGSATAHRDAR